MVSTKPTIVDESAHAEFLDKDVAAQLVPTGRWVTDYVSFSRGRARPFFLRKRLPAVGRKMFEFGCSLGASSIMFATICANVDENDNS